MTKLRRFNPGWPRWRGLLSALLLVSLALLLSGAELTEAETFDSGSTGADGDLILTTPGTINFDPRAFNPPLDPDGDNIYHFGTITIGAGVTVRLSATYIDGPVVWLASGAVTINGLLDLRGEDGQNQSTSAGNGLRFPSVPGAGGYPGGVGNFSDTPGSPAQPGAGPGGGNIVSGSGTGCAASAISACGKAAYGNAYLVPLVGGSGGGGGQATGANYVGAAGGAGGGALLVASSTSIAVAGQIWVGGGAGGTGGGTGSAGAIRLVAPTISGTGDLNARGAGAVGRIRLEAFQYLFTGNLNPIAGRGTPSGLFLDQARQPVVRITSVASANVPTIPTGSFSTPDVTINSTSAVNVTIQARGIPPGTTVKLVVIPEVGTDLVLDSPPLAGTLEQSTATVSVTLPPGYIRMYVYSNWTP